MWGAPRAPRPKAGPSFSVPVAGGIGEVEGVGGRITKGEREPANGVVMRE